MSPPQTPVLVAGVGNIFFGDDGFGVEVVKRLRSEQLPEWVRLVDFGIRGLHLAYELLDGKFPTLVLIDTAARGGRPGDVYLVQPDRGFVDEQRPPDPHGMTPGAVLHALQAAECVPEHIYLVGCEPACTEEGIGLSEPVSRAVDVAIKMIFDLLGSLGQAEHRHA